MKQNNLEKVKILNGPIELTDEEYKKIEERRFSAEPEKVESDKDKDLDPC